MSLSDEELTDLRRGAWPKSRGLQLKWLTALLATIESRDQRISQLEEAIDVLLEAAALSWAPAWFTAVASLKHARGPQP